MTKNLIELNGNIYDARTGKLVKQVTSSQPKPPQQILSELAMRNPSAKRPQQAPTYKKRVIPTKSKTLMRTAVQKPVASKASPINDIPQLQPRKPATFISNTRLERATKTLKSNAINRFHSGGSDTQPPRSTVTENSNPSTHIPERAASAPPPPTAIKPNNDQVGYSPEQAITNAMSHEETYNQPGFINKLIDTAWNRSKLVRYGIVAVCAFAVVLTSVQLARPTVSMRLASNRSGIPASMPKYRPAGFVLSDSIESSQGQIAMHYQSVSDNRNFKISKEKTDWTSEALRVNYVEGQGLYQTISSKGKTIYLYGETNATWIDGGIWYTIEGASHLNSDQLLRIANGL